MCDRTRLVWFLPPWLSSMHGSGCLDWGWLDQHYRRSHIAPTHRIHYSIHGHNQSVWIIIRNQLWWMKDCLAITELKLEFKQGSKIKGIWALFIYFSINCQESAQVVHQPYLISDVLIRMNGTWGSSGQRKSPGWLDFYNDKLGMTSPHIICTHIINKTLRANHPCYVACFFLRNM